MTYPCPYCGAPANLETGCPSCGRGPDPDAAEVIRTDAEISVLIGELATARKAVSDLEVRISQAWQRRHKAAARVRLAVGAPPPPETSSRAVQNVLFTLGGLLLGVAAIVFTAVAWAQFGLTGRAVLLGVVTLVALAVPPLALRRGLTATAETMAAVGLLLTLLDGYAAWYVNLFGVADGSPARFAGVVCLVTVVIAAGYALVTGLTGPRVAALLVVQPALPLLVGPADPGPAGWSLTFGAIAALNLVAARRALLVPLAYVCAAGATLIALLPAAIAGIDTLRTARPVFHAAWQAAVPSAGWRLPAALALVAAALFLALPPRARPAALVAGASAVALALPAGLHLPWWNGPILDLVALVALVAALAPAGRRAAPALAPSAARVAALPAAASPSAPVAAASAVTFVCQVVAVVLLGAHALAAGFGRPGVAAGVLVAFALLGAALAVRGGNPVLADGGKIVALLSLPAIAWTGAAALGLAHPAQVRAVTVAAAVGLLIVAFTRAGAAALAAVPPLAVTLLVAETDLVPGAASLVVLGVIVVAAAVAGRVGPTAAGRGLGVAVAVAGGLAVALTRPAGSVLEAYTILGSCLALAGAFAAKRAQTPSWAAYGPALIIGLVPSLITVLTNDEGQQLRRLLLGIAALAILLAGAKFRLRAPVVAGGGTVAVVALHELGLVWELIPRWIPLAAGGLLLVLVAATLESRRRDLSRMRHALGRMS
ncbi:SCO7613 C-terminal domain-containing membrane protein [Paractinoplanes globisporus]|uniref:SCO7613 C-terminal domain-containing membrane protein n=1 Tax=Paractinoplanes globisporus TaxID=113565 RepID=A0ABW6WFP1_9ACTN|nr:hypothetical protein [Actinoplanes globisporus]